MITVYIKKIEKIPENEKLNIKINNSPKTIDNQLLKSKSIFASLENLML